MPVKLVLVALKEVVRARKIAAGVHHAHHAYHHGFFIMVIIGYVKGQCPMCESSHFYDYPWSFLPILVTFMQKQGPFKCLDPYFCGNPAEAHDEYEGKK